jgi:hypothetical protein
MSLRPRVRVALALASRKDCRPLFSFPRAALAVATCLLLLLLLAAAGGGLAYAYHDDEDDDERVSQGPPGPQGPQGPQGDPGPGGTVTSVQAGTNGGLQTSPPAGITTEGTISVTPGGITSTMIQDGAVGNGDLADGAVSVNKLAPDSVNSSKILDGSINAGDVNTAQIQQRVTGTCTSGAIQTIAENGGVTCGGAGGGGGGTVTSVQAIEGLTAAPNPITGSGTISVAPGGITNAMIQDNAVTTTKIQDGAVANGDLADGAVTSAKLANNSVNGTKIADGSVTSADLAPDSVNSSKILDGSINAGDVNTAQIQQRVTGTCTSGAIQTIAENGGVTCGGAGGGGGGTVTSVGTGAGLTGGPITGSGTISVATGGITGTLLAPDSVDSSKIVNGSVALGDLAPNSVDGSKIADGSIKAVDVDLNQVQLRVSGSCPEGSAIRVIRADGVTGACEEDDVGGGGTVTSVGTPAGSGITLSPNPIIATGTISVAPGGITSAMILDGAVANGDLADGAVTLNKIAPNSVNGSKIADGSIKAVDVDLNQVQLRVSGSCAVGSAIRVINADGVTGACQVVGGGRVTSVGTPAGSGITLSPNPIIATGTISVAPGGITSAMILDGAVANGDLADGAVTLNKIASNSVDGTNIADGSVGLADLAPDSVNGDKILDSSINVDDVNTAQIQRRVTGMCPPGSSIRVINRNGTVVCETDDPVLPLSSSRFKEQIHDMGEATSGLLRLRPVTFHYKEAFANGARLVQYGLIAEEVAEVYPDLVVYSPTGEVETVQYPKLVPMLLNELQKQHRRLDALQADNAALKARLEAVERIVLSKEALAQK